MVASMPLRKIIHVDMDAFFTSVEQRDNPNLRGKPIAVGGSKDRGVVAAASYEARKYGVRSAMPSRLAYQKCPHIIFVKHRFDVYRNVSQQIRKVFYEYTDLVEPLSLDEAYLDVSDNKYHEDSAIVIAQQIKDKIKATTGLTASAGVSINKFLAKVASDIHKPDGLTVILPDQVEAFLEELPIEQFFGVGKKMAERLKSRQILTGLELKQHSRIQLATWYGKFGSYLYDMVRGNDSRLVKPHRLRKSISSETTYDQDIVGLNAVKTALARLITKLADSCDDKSIMGKTANIKVRYSDFTTYTRSKTLGGYFNDADTLTQLSHEMLDSLTDLQPVRLLGVGLSNLNTDRADQQLIIDFPAYD